MDGVGWALPDERFGGLVVERGQALEHIRDALA